MSTKVIENPLPRILVVDDDPIVADSLAEFLKLEGYGTATANDGLEALAILDAIVPADQQPFGVLVTDLSMPRLDGMGLLKAVKQKYDSVVPIVITGFGKIESAVEAVKLGAIDYLTKPVIEDELRIAVSKAIRQYTLVAENHLLKSQLVQRYGLDNVVGADYRMQRVYDLVEAVATSRTTVLISGESGTGKSLIARAIHTKSQRTGGPFVTFACGSVPETLLESELFGHVKGAFTGADADKPGKVLAANGGTLFIDEINSATASLQLKLLRTLQERQFEPVGSHQTIQVDVRFVLATNQSLPDLVKQGRFREDLYYRINVVNIPLPSLRDRLGDVPMLAEHFLIRFCAETNKERRFSPEALDALRRYHWPGNVRELENAVERAVVLSRRTLIEVNDLPEALHPPSPFSLSSSLCSYSSSDGGAGQADAANGDPQAGASLTLPALANGWTPMPLEQALWEPERRIILAALKANQWNRQETAKQLNINRTTLYKKIKQFHLDQAG